MKLHISVSNTKMGKVPSVSLVPGLSCKPGIPCFKSGCYALKLMKLRPGVKKAWMENWNLWKKKPTEYMKQIEEYLRTKEPAMFRWHVAGDIPDKEYLTWMQMLACLHPRTSFMAFTKRGDLMTTRQCAGPKNLNIVLSMWPGIEDDWSEELPRAWMRDPKNPDPRIPKDAKECDGGCEKCGLCWNLKPGQSVWFARH